MENDKRKEDDTKDERPTEERESGYERVSRVVLEPERKRVSTEIAMLDDELARARRLIERNGWSNEEGLHIVFSRGLVALEHDGEATEHEGKRLIDMNTPEARERFLLARLNELESKYSVMKFTAFNALKDNQSLAMNVTGLSTEYQALSTQNKYLRGREDELRVQVDVLRASAAPTMPAVPTTRWRRLRELAREVFR